jgi:hypothetical protein
MSESTTSLSSGFRTARPFVISLRLRLRAILGIAMTHFPQPNSQQRATRVKMEATASALVKLEDGQRAKAKIQTVSVTGGLLRLARALGEGDFVEVAFQTQSGPVHGMAEMLHPRRISADGILQPFRFIALDDNDHKTLSFAVSSTTERNFLLGSTQLSTRKV